jgi:hypothetical protein
MAFLVPLFLIVGVLLAAPQIVVGILVVGIGAGISAAVSRLVLGRPELR